MEAEPRLKEYTRHIEDIIEEAKHILSKEEEKLISSFAPVFSGYSNIYDILTNTELKFEDVEDSEGKKHSLSNSMYSVHLASRDNALRKNAFNNIYKAYSSKKNTISEILLRDIKLDSVSCVNRKYNSTMEANLISDESSSKVYNTLVNSVRDNININHRWIHMKKVVLEEELDLDEINMYDVYVNPFESENEKKISYEDAKVQVKKALNVLGSEYIENLELAFSNGWIDVYPKDDKQDGAFSYGIYGVHPYVLLNFVGLQNDVSTIAHELGHAMHSYYSDNNQPKHLSSYTIMVAEVASTVNEILLAEYLIKNEEDIQKKKSLLWGLIDTIRATLVRQTMFAEFEEYIREATDKGEILTEEILSEKYLKLVKEYFGNDVVINEEIKYEYLRIPHFYSAYYVYKYATGISSAIYIAKNILDKKETYLEKYMKMLKSGGSKKALDILKIAEVDLEDSGTYENAFKYLEEKINEFEELIENK